MPSSAYMFGSNRHSAGFIPGLYISQYLHDRNAFGEPKKIQKFSEEEIPRLTPDPLQQALISKSACWHFVHLSSGYRHIQQYMDKQVQTCLGLWNDTEPILTFQGRDSTVVHWPKKQTLQANSTNSDCPR